MNVSIPKRFDSKAAIREFIQTREFITAIKQSMMNKLRNSINCSNGMIDLVNDNMELIKKHSEKKEKTNH